jgi:mycothiol synthase
VQPVHFPLIWAAQEEVTRELFERVDEYWTPENYKAWTGNPGNTPELWQVAWDGERVAGMVLARIDSHSNRVLNRLRGYTEHIFARKPWRQRGLAAALIARSLAVLQAQGMEEVELAVDAENDSGAFAFYQRLGFRTFSTDIWYRKPMDGEREGP